jgi:ElaB/YqjD/DUF883 family membrane-anchored ribosome-binding protein
MKTQEDIEYLKGSIKIPEQRWKDLPENSEISYLRKDGKFVKRCFIKVIYARDEVDYILCANKLTRYNNDKYYSEYKLRFDSLDEIWKRVTQDAIIEYKLIRAKVENDIQKLVDRIETLESLLKDESEKTQKLARLVKHFVNAKK